MCASQLLVSVINRVQFVVPLEAQIQYNLMQELLDILDKLIFKKILEKNDDFGPSSVVWTFSTVSTIQSRTTSSS